MPLRLSEHLEHDRPRERFWAIGPGALTGQELLAILIGTGTRGRDALAVAGEILGRGDGSLRKLAARPCAELSGIPGVGRAKAARRLETDCFLVSRSGGQLQGESVASVLDRLCARLQRQGFDEAHLHAHVFRHDYITRKALDGENPSVLKRWVGHRTFAMTDRCFGIAESKLAAVRPNTVCWTGSFRCRKNDAADQPRNLEPKRVPQAAGMLRSDIRSAPAHTRDAEHPVGELAATRKGRISLPGGCVRQLSCVLGTTRCWMLAYRPATSQTRLG